MELNINTVYHMLDMFFLFFLTNMQSMFVNAKYSFYKRQININKNIKNSGFFDVYYVAFAYSFFLTLQSI